MSRQIPDKGSEPDPRLSPIQVAERIWWVGHVQEDDDFQCHVYLLEQGDQSVLFDPGSKLTFRHTLRKIEQIIPFSKIRYFVCHHQDPDIAGAMPVIDEMVSRGDAALVTHWRARALLKHYDLRLPFWLVDQNEWELQLEDRLLKFVFTPYAHFPGAFCSFDTRTGSLFSSDLFGGFTKEFSLIAQDESHFEALRPFHEHYIPSRDILSFALAQMEQHPVRIILPQHGSIIPEHLVAFMFAKLKELDCGLYLMNNQSTDIQRLSRLNQALRDITQTMVLSRDFRDIAKKLLEIAQRLLPACSLEFYALTDEGALLNFAPENRYRGALSQAPLQIASIIGVDRKHWRETEASAYKQIDMPRDQGGEDPSILLPLFSPGSGDVRGVAVIRLAKRVSTNDDIEQIVAQMELALQVAVERETIYRALDLERERIYERSIRDPLTGLFTRLYMQDTVQRLFAIQERDESALISLALLDIDRFKHINDSYGHNQGDIVLRRVARVLRDNVRGGDLPVRLGGDELALFMVGESARGATRFAERLRELTTALNFAAPMDDLTVTISVGIAVRREMEGLTSFIERADKALYRAKESGRNRVSTAP